MNRFVVGSQENSSGQELNHLDAAIRASDPNRAPVGRNNRLYSRDEEDEDSGSDEEESESVHDRRVSSPSDKNLS